MGISASKVTKEFISESTSGIDGRICEMAVVNSQLIDVPVDSRIDIDTITADDPDPKFVNVEVLRAGISNGNNRRYNNNIVKEVNDMIPGCQGFFGHPDPSKYGFEFREPQCIFVGSTIEHMPDGLDRTIAKCYLFKTSPLREWVPKSIAAGNPMTVSINGTGDIMKNGDILDVIHMRDLQSVDWANPGTEGMETSKAMSVVREMNEINEGGNEKMGETINVQDIIKNATVTEFKAFNPSGYNAMLQGVTVQELLAINPTLVETITNNAKVTEMSVTVNGKQETVKLTGMQAKFDAYESKITELQGKIEESKITEYKASKIAEKVPENLRDAISKRVSGKTEADIDASIDAEIAYVREMGGMDNLPLNNQQNKDTGSDVKTSVRALFGVKEESK